MKRTICLALPALCLAATVSAAQTPSAILREGDTLVGAPAGQVVTSLGGTNANNYGGYVVEVNSSDGSGTDLSHCWGTANGSSPAILQTEGTYGPLVQTSFESFLGISNAGSVCYSASGTGGPAGGFDSVWLGSTPIAVEGDPIASMPGKYFRFGSRPGVTGDGHPYFVGGITSTVGGSTENYALFYGASPVALLKGGDSVPNLPAPLSTASSVSFDYRISTLGSNYIAEVKMSGPGITTANDYAMVLSGQGLMLGGSLVQEGTVVPVSVGGNGTEAWAYFDYCGVTESGHYLFTGDTNGNTATDEFVLVDGVIVHREGDTIDGQVVSGSIETASMNEDGEYAYVWDVSGGTLEALFAGADLLAMEGDEVDWDGDGVVDAGHVITDFSGIASLSLGSESIVYFTADVDTNGGGVLEGLFGMCARSAQSSEITRLGSPPNPNALLPGLTSGPIVGGTWDPVIDHTTFATGAIADFIGVDTEHGPLSLPTGFGTLLIWPPPSSQLFFSVPAGAPFSINIPDICSLVGIPAWAQGGSYSPGGVIEFANGLDLVLGSY